MPLRERAGELLLGLIFLGAGLFWVLQAVRLPLWDGFAPASGFMPLIFGVLLVALAAAATAVSVLTAAAPEQPSEPVQKVLLVLLALVAGVAGIENAGFCASTFLVMLFLYRVVERHALVASVLAATGTAIMLTVIFRHLLGGPRPPRPWGL